MFQRYPTKLNFELCNALNANELDDKRVDYLHVVSVSRKVKRVNYFSVINTT